MATVTRLEELDVWQRARLYSRMVNMLLRADGFAGETGLKMQMKNASGSIMDNIAEGFGRGSKHEFVNHLSFARGSLEESRSQLYRCADIQLIDAKVFEELKMESETLLRQITGLMNYLNRSIVKGTKFKNRNTNNL